MPSDIFTIGGTLPEGYHQALRWLERAGEADGGVSHEIAVTIRVERPFEEPRISRQFIGGPYDLERYRQEMLDGILDFEVDRGKWAYTYHQRYAPHLQFCIDELRRDPHSRRAVISVRDNEADEAGEDPACLQSIQYMIRNGALDCYALFRSNDAVKAAFMNMYALTELQKKVADALGVPVGVYTHRANSFHCYRQDAALLGGYILRLNNGEKLYYNYAGEWDELMKEAKPEIAEMVRKLRENDGT